MSPDQHLAALRYTAWRISVRHGSPFLIPIPANENWCCDEDGA